MAEACVKRSDIGTNCSHWRYAREQGFHVIQDLLHLAAHNGVAIALIVTAGLMAFTRMSV